jgi:predicted kinase
MSTSAKLMFLCGKMASGKSTLAKDLAQREHAILLVQSSWIACMQRSAEGPKQGPTSGYPVDHGCGARSRHCIFFSLHQKMNSSMSSGMSAPDAT